MSPRQTENEDDLTVVIPGDDVTSIIKKQASGYDQNLSKKRKIKLGSGLRESADETILATCAGRLMHRSTNTAHAYYVQHTTKRYRPHAEDRVIGIVQDRVASDGTGGDVYTVDIGAPHLARLSNLSFEGATKRNKPSLPPGTLLYTRVLPDAGGGENKDADIVEPNLSCQVGPNDVGVVRKEWMTNEGTYGELRGGMVHKVSLTLARELLRPSCVVLQELGNPRHKLPFELCVGVNGRVWVHSTRPEHTIMIQNAISNSQVLTEPQVRAMVPKLIATVRAQMEKTDQTIYE